MELTSVAECLLASKQSYRVDYLRHSCYMKIKYQAIPASPNGVALHDKPRVVSSKIYLNFEVLPDRYLSLLPIFSTVATSTGYTPGRSIPELPDCHLGRSSCHAQTYESAYTPFIATTPATIPVVPDLVDHIRQHIISRCIHRDAYSSGPTAILVLNAPASLRRSSYH